MPSAILPESQTGSVTSPAEFKLAIIGGGIGGLTTALSIAKQNPSLNHITVYEQAPAYKEIGAGVGIGVNAGRILKKLGVWDAANAISGERNGVHRSIRRYDNGEEIVSVGAMDENADGGVRQLSVHRAEILDVLYQELRRNYFGRVTLETDMKSTKVEVCLRKIVLQVFVLNNYCRIMVMKLLFTSKIQLIQQPLQTWSLHVTAFTATFAHNSHWTGRDIVDVLHTEDSCHSVPSARTGLTQLTLSAGWLPTSTFLFSPSLRTRHSM